MNVFNLFQSRIVTALGLALCLWVFDINTGFAQRIRTPAFTPDSDSGHRPGSRGRPPSFGPGLRIRIPRIVPGPRIEFEEPVFDEPAFEEPVFEKPRRQVPRRIEKPPRVKLARPRVPYLKELAMDMDPSLVELVMRDPRKAIRVYKQALRRSQRGKHPKKEWKATTELGHVYYLTGRFAQAENQYVQAADMSAAEHDSEGQAIGLRNMGATLIASGKHTEAEGPNLTALELFISIDHPHDAQMTLNNLGVLEKNRGRYPNATAYFEQALTRTHDPDLTRMLVLRNFGTFHVLWGEYDRAIDDFTAYGSMAGSLGNEEQAAEAFLDVASVYARQGSYDRALFKIREAVRMQSNANIDTDWSKKLMGDVLLEMGRSAEAEKYITEAGYDSSQGLLFLITSRPQQAKKHYERLLNAATKEQNLDEMFSAHTGLGKAYEAMKDYARAERHYAEAVDITEDIRASLLFAERRNFFAEKVNGFARSEAANGLARVALKRKNPVKSIYAGEVTKARQFADNLSQKTEARYFEVPPDLLEQEAELTNKLAALKTALHAVPRALDRPRFKDMLNEIKQEDSRCKAFVQTLCRQHKDYCSVKYPEPVGIQDSGIRDAENILVFDVLGDSVGITLLKGKRVVRSFLTQWPSDDLEKQVKRLRRPFEQVQLTKFSPELAARLYEKLLARALESVPAGSSITIIPDGPLALVPFEALVVRGKPVWSHGPQGDYPAGLTYLADLYSIAYYQSLTAMSLVRTLGKHKRNGSRMLVMADPVFEASDERLAGTALQVAQAQDVSDDARSQDTPNKVLLGGMSLRRLAESEKLGKSLKELLGAHCQLYTGLACTKQQFLETFSGNVDPYSAVVFGTHGFAANDLPGIMEPVLALTMVPRGIDGLLTMSEVAGLSMDVDIAALTACKTGLGMRLAGEGVMSMGRAFQAAGARSVIMSLWSVAESPSILLMDEFFKELAQGKDKLAAWTSARAHVRNQGFEHPFFWASFILVGETQ